MLVSVSLASLAILLFLLKALLELSAFFSDNITHPLTISPCPPHVLLIGRLGQLDQVHDGRNQGPAGGGRRLDRHQPQEDPGGRREGVSLCLIALGASCDRRIRKRLRQIDIWVCALPLCGGISRKLPFFREAS